MSSSGLGKQRSYEIGGAGRWQAEIGGVHVLFGSGRLSDLALIAGELDLHRALLVSDAGLRRAGHVATAESVLRATGLEVATFEDVSENPSSSDVQKGAEFGASFEPDCIVALGGGSALDSAKGINFVLSNGGDMADYWGYGKATSPLLPSIGIPTTAGTGSEAQSFAVISDAATRRKMACGDPEARFRAVILDPSLLTSVPAEVAAASGFDAIGHAVESYVTRRSNPISKMLARQAWTSLEATIERALDARSTEELRGETLVAAHLAGAAIEQSMLGAAHACANPLTATSGVSHGVAIAIMLPAVIRFNGQVARDEYQELAKAARLTQISSSTEALAARLQQIRSSLKLPGSLREVGLERDRLPNLADAAANEWTASFNPRSVDKTDLQSIYESVY